MNREGNLKIASALYFPSLYEPQGTQTANRDTLLSALSQFSVNRKRVLDVRVRVLQTTLPHVHQAEVAKHPTLVAAIVSLAEDCQYTLSLHDAFRSG